MNDKDEARLRQACDRSEIQDVLLLYFRAMDTRQVELCRDVFTADVESVYAVPKPAGIEAHMESFHAMSGKLNVKALRLTRRGAEATGDLPLKHTTHFVGNMSIRVDGDTADAETYVIANLFYEADGVDHVIVRSLRYIDKLVRTGDGWRIRRRTHTLDWVREGEASYVVPFAERAMAG